MLRQWLGLLALIVVLTGQGPYVVPLPLGAPLWSCFLESVTVTTQCQAAPAGGLRNYVNSVALTNQAITGQSLDLVAGTGANCATGLAALTHKWQFGTLATTTSPFVVALDLSLPIVPAAGAAICVRPSAATAFGATLTGYIAP